VTEGGGSVGVAYVDFLLREDGVVADDKNNR
jgi:hypothetical protein